MLSEKISQAYTKRFLIHNILMTENIHAILKEYWGYDTFRPLQEDIIASVLNGHDTLGLLPTGGGKSITFQVPALALGGLTLVVTPLISLMKDQCDHLVERGIKAAAVFMGMTHKEVLETYERVISEDYRFLYLSPERLETQLFQAKLRYMNVRLLVVDEAHCISQWGYDFRPPYLKIANLRNLLKEINAANRFSSYEVPCLALTATATKEVIDDIQDKLHFRKGSQVFKASFERPNLVYSVIHTEDKLGTLRRLLNKILVLGDNAVNENADAIDFSQKPSAIVYVRSRKKTAEIAEHLTLNGIDASFYHAGLKPEEKQKRQDNWMAGHPAVIVATNAFGMGIDKPNVRAVIHIDLPPSPEEYFQEAGRAGRDGKPAQAWIINESGDKLKLLRHLEDEYPQRDFIRHVYGRLASFYQIAIAAGYGNLFEFDIMRFCAAYHLSLTQVHYALKLLDQAGYISYIEEPDRHSRLMFTTSRDSLYRLNQFDPECQRIIQCILRLYTGLFADYVYIREEEIMRYTGLDQQTLYDKLLLLSRFHVLHYIPARKMPAIYYLTPRLEDEELRISHIVYEDRRLRQEKRIRAMIDYIENDKECRLVQLLRYFGEELNHRCLQCDVCESENLSGNIHEEREAIRQLILTSLRAKGPIAIQSLIAQMQQPPQQVSEVLQEMVAAEDICLKNNILSL